MDSRPMDWTYFVSISFVIIWFLLPLAAGTIAHRKGQSWLLAVLVGVLAPPLGVAVACFQEVRPGLQRRQASLRWKLLLGLLPIWAALAWMVAGGITAQSADYWQSAPWMLVAALPACGFTLVLVELLVGVLRK